jgi:hypothetical protein
MNSHNVYDTITRCTCDTLEAVHQMEPQQDHPGLSRTIQDTHGPSITVQPQPTVDYSNIPHCSRTIFCSRKPTLQPHHVRSRITQYADTPHMQPHHVCSHITGAAILHVCSNPHLSRATYTSQPHDALTAVNQHCPHTPALRHPRPRTRAPSTFESG